LADRIVVDMTEMTMPPTKTVEIDIEAQSDGIGLDMASLKLSAPRTMPSDKDDVCMAKAVVMPAKAVLKLRVRNLKVARIVDGRIPTLLARVGRPVRDFLMALDSRVVATTKENNAAWFLHQMDADLVEDYYRSSTVTDAAHGVLARFVLDSTPIPPHLLSPCNVVDAVLQLVGVQFRRQYYTVVWKVVSSVAAEVQSCAFGLSDGDDSASESDADDVGPTDEDTMELRRALASRLLEEESVQEDRLDTLRDLLRTLDASPVTDLTTLNVVDERFGELMSAWSSLG
jgi:hypothetical protein